MVVTSELVVMHGVPHAIVPSGRHVFAADAAALRDLRAAIVQDLSRIDWVSDAEIERAVPRRLELPALRAFVDAHRDAIRAHWDVATIRTNTRRHAHERLDALRDLHAPDVVIATAEATLEAVSSPTWDASFDLDALMPDVRGAASLVDDVDPRYVEVDVSSIVLIALLGCIDADATSLVHDEEIEGSPMVEDYEIDARPGGVSVRAAVQGDLLRLESIEVATSVAPRGAWVLVET